jgi:SagB-type dehydrogenase family enzyme
MNDRKKDVIVKLPEPRLESAFSIEKALHLRRSVRVFATDTIGLSDVSQLLWAAQGITAASGERTAPSAGATYPLEMYAAAGRVNGLAAGLYRYRAPENDLVRTLEGDILYDLSTAAVGQGSVYMAAAVFVITAVHERTTLVYGRRGIRYVDNEVGHAAENLFLQAVALGLGSVAVGAFDDEAVSKVLRLPAVHRPMYLLPVGKPG